MGELWNLLLEGFASVLNFFYSMPGLGGSYGVAIILLTLSMMVVMMPLTIKGTKSTLRLTALQPQLKAIQKKHGSDRLAMNAEIQQFYRDNKINPVGGCLPILAQMPVFLLLFNVIRGITRRISDMPFYEISKDAWKEAGNEVDSEFFAPRFLDHSTDLYNDLTHDTEMDFLLWDLGSQAWDVIRDTFVGGLPYVLLIAVVVGSSYFQQYQIQSRRAGSAPAMPQQQKIIMRVLPVLSGVWSFIFPAGLVLYWATSNLFRIGQQHYITKQVYSKHQDDIDASSASLEEVEETEVVSRPKKELSDREKQWAEKRKSKSNKVSNKSKRPTNGNSSRVTPKGTQPKKKKSK